MTTALMLNIVIATAGFAAIMALVAWAIRTAHHHDGRHAFTLHAVPEPATEDVERRAA